MCLLNFNTLVNIERKEKLIVRQSLIRPSVIIYNKVKNKKQSGYVGQRKASIESRLKSFVTNIMVGIYQYNIHKWDN